MHAIQRDNAADEADAVRIWGRPMSAIRNP